MICFHADVNSYKEVATIESSFGFFINSMINKMNPLIASEDLPMWDKGNHIHEYLEELKSKLAPLKKADGLVEDDDYMDRLPDYTERNSKKANGGNMKSKKKAKSELEKLAPTGTKANVGKKPRKSRKKKEASENDGPKVPKMKRYNRDLEYLEKGNDLTTYYKALIQHIAKTVNIRFDDPHTDAQVGVEILDLLRENGVKNKEFLDEWITYFYEHSLKGNKVLNPEHTSLSSFRYTFERFKDTRYIPQ